MKRFIKIPTMVFELGLSPLQLLVYAGIVSLKTKENCTIATAKTIAKRCNISSNSVYTAVNALKSFRLIDKTNYIRNGKNTANGYFIRNIGGNFVKIEYDLFKLDLSPSEFAAYVAIKSKCDKAHCAYPSLRQISELAHICIDTVISAIKELAGKGLLLFKRYMRRCGCFGHNNYTVFESATIREEADPKNIKLNITKEAAYYERNHKKAAFLFLNKKRYSKFWATLLDSSLYVRKKINTLIKTICFSKLRV